MLLKLPNNDWKIQRGLLKQMSLKETSTSFVLLDVLLSLPDIHRTLGQSGPHDAIPLPLYGVRQFSEVRAKVCVSSPRRTQLVCLVLEWGQSKGQDISTGESGPGHLHLYTCSSLLYAQRKRKKECSPIYLVVCSLKFVRFCYQSISPYTGRGHTELLLRMHQFQALSAESMCLCVFLH